jgi:hypothetical protein
VTTYEQPPTAVTRATPRRRRHLGRWLVAALLVLAVVAVTVRHVGSRPHLESGWTQGADPAAVHEVGSVTGTDLGNTWWVDSGDGTYWSVVRNDGRAPVTLRGAGLDIALRQKVTFATVVNPYDRFGTPVDSITVRPGQEVQVLVHLEVCGDTFRGGPGSSTSVEGLDVKATTWGLTRTVHLDMGGSYGFYNKTGPALPASPDCPEVPTS